MASGGLLIILGGEELGGVREYVGVYHSRRKDYLDFVREREGGAEERKRTT